MNNQLLEPYQAAKVVQVVLLCLNSGGITHWGDFN